MVPRTVSGSSGARSLLRSWGRILRAECRSVATVHQAGHKVGAHVSRATDDIDLQHLSLCSSSEDNRSENTVHLSAQLEARYSFPSRLS